MIRHLVAFVLCIALVGTRPATCQTPVDSTRRLLLRLEGGSMNPDDPFTVTLAYGAQIGWQLNERNALFFHGSMQELSLDIAGYPRDDLRRYLSVGYERYLGQEDRYRQQFALRFGAGLAFRGDLGTAPFVSGGVAIRYALSRRFAFLGTFEDAIVALPTDTLQDCRFDPCAVYRTGGKTQHNFGMFISLELRP
jgi:hypothetical protein